MSALGRCRFGASVAIRECTKDSRLYRSDCAPGLGSTIGRIRLTRCVGGTTEVRNAGQVIGRDATRRGLASMDLTDAYPLSECCKTSVASNSGLLLGLRM